MHPAREPDFTLLRFFSGLTEYAFEARLGVVDPPLVDYISQLLARFVACDAVYSVRTLDGRRLEEVAGMMAEAEARVGDARREVHRHIGDFTLFWTGVYPEALRRLQGRERMDHLLDYQQQGKRAYFIASTLETDETKESEAPAEVLARLSARFELCQYGLGEVRREWERREGGETPPRPFLIN